MCTRPGNARERGLTIIELVVFIVIISLALAGTLVAVVRINRNIVDPLQRKQAMLRAESLLEEVALSRFTYCHPDDANADTAASSTACASLPEDFGPQMAGDSRPFFNINDYASAAILTTDASGASLTPRGYDAVVTITPVAAFGPESTPAFPGSSIGSVASPKTPADAEMLLISVAVTYTGGTVKLERYRARYAPNSAP